MFLTNTLVREMKAKSEEVRKKVNEGKSCSVKIELIEEPGEILITRMMEKDQIEEALKEAVKEVMLPEKNFKVKDIGYGSDSIWFTVTP
jgi:hypothetical protein